MSQWTLRNGAAEALLPGEWAGQVDLVVTSPPYDALREYGGGQGDFNFEAVADALLPCLKEGGIIAWNVADQVRAGSETGTSFRQALGFMARGLRLVQTLIYERAQPTVLTAERYLSNFQYVFILSQGAPGYIELLRDRENLTAGSYRAAVANSGRTGDRKPVPQPGRPFTIAEVGRRAAIWRYAAGGAGQARRGEEFAHDHPALMPWRLAADLIRSYSPPGGLVLDPMAGGGTTLREAVNLGRRAVGVELNPEYCALIERRMAQQALSLDGAEERE